MARSLNLFCLFVIILFSSPSFAADFEERPWSFGIISGAGFGIQNFDDINGTPDCQEAFFCFIVLALEGLEQIYAVTPVMATGSYQFNRRFALRFSLGIDIYSGQYYNDAPPVLPAAEALAMFHFRNKRALFHPYGLVGLRFPLANPTLGLGNQFTVSKRVSLLLEVLANSIIVDTKIEARAGVVLHY